MVDDAQPELREACHRWGLEPDGDPVVTPTSLLVPVVRGTLPLMLKIARVEEEARGSALMAWWDGNGAAEVLEHEGNALLMARSPLNPSLTEMAQCGRDDEATRILCDVAHRLHRPRGGPRPPLESLSRWFEALERATPREWPLARAASVARDLLQSPEEVAVLHGDIHHANVLPFGGRWLAIDPKGLVGERGFDYANILRNPDAQVATRRGRFARQVDVVTEAAGVDRTRLLQWVLSLAGLSAAWHRSDGKEPHADIAIAELAIAELAT